MFLSSANPAPCYNDTVDLICNCPDLMERVNGQLRYTATTPSWRMNGQTLFLNGDVFIQTSINQTASRLEVRIDPVTFTGDPVSFTCYLPLNGGGEDNSSTVVDPQGTFTAFSLNVLVHVAIPKSEVQYHSSLTYLFLLLLTCTSEEGTLRTVWSTYSVYIATYYLCFAGTSIHCI